jgi:Predicted transcriptional regulators
MDTEFPVRDLYISTEKGYADIKRRYKPMDQQKTGLFLKKLRHEKSVTQMELAERLGVSNRSVSRWENGTTMPDFDLIIELARYYDVEVGELLDGERRADSMNTETEELMLKISDYNNLEKSFFSKKMCIMFLVAITGMLVFAVIDIAGLERTQPYETIVSTTLGFVLGTLLTGLLYASRYITKIRAAKIRLAQKLGNLKNTADAETNKQTDHL